MAKSQRPAVDVDEDLIKSMMSDDVPRAREEPGDTVPAFPGREPNSPALKPEKQTPQSPKAITRRPAGDYEVSFLRKLPRTERRQTYIDQRLFTQINMLLSVMAPGITLPVFLDNLLTHHLENYKDDINELYNSKFNKTPLR